MIIFLEKKANVQLKVFACRKLGHVKTFILALILVFPPWTVLADINMANSALKDFNLAGFNDAKLIGSEIGSEANNYRLALGSIRKKQNQLRPELEITLSAEINRLTFEIAREYGPNEVFQYFFDQLKSKSFDILYQCHAAECGSNAHWANRIFKQRLLNGVERSQHYIVAQLNVSGTANLSRYVVFYLVQRGNKRLYVHFDLVAASADQASPVLDSQFYYEQLKTLKRVRVRGLTITNNYHIDSDKSEKALESVVYLLQNHPELKLVVVGHAYGLAPVAKNQENSLLLANSFNNSLEAQGLKSLPTYGLGPLAPNVTDATHASTEWVELVLVPAL